MGLSKKSKQIEKNREKVHSKIPTTKRNCLQRTIQPIEKKIVERRSTMRGWTLQEDSANCNFICLIFFLQKHLHGLGYLRLIIDHSWAHLLHAICVPNLMAFAHIPTLNENQYQNVWWGCKRKRNTLLKKDKTHTDVKMALIVLFASWKSEGGARKIVWVQPPQAERIFFLSFVPLF